jgi:hypothetical protein
MMPLPQRQHRTAPPTSAYSQSILCLGSRRRSSTFLPPYSYRHARHLPISHHRYPNGVGYDPVRKVQSSCLSFLTPACRPIALAFGITMPFLGVLVRYRANYAPKRGVRLTDGEDWEITRSETESYFGMMRRVHRLEVCFYGFFEWEAF